MPKNTPLPQEPDLGDGAASLGLCGQKKPQNVPQVRTLLRGVFFGLFHRITVFEGNYVIPKSIRRGKNEKACIADASCRNPPQGTGLFLCACISLEMRVK